MSFVDNTRSLNLSAARQMTEAATAFASENKRNISIAVVDSAGELLTLTRMDGAIAASTEIAYQKARTSVRFKCPTKDLEAGVSSGATSLLKLDLLPFEGGIPIFSGGQVAGAIGVSGHSPAGDGEVAKAGAEWIARQLG